MRLEISRFLIKAHSACQFQLVWVISQCLALMRRNRAAILTGICCVCHGEIRNGAPVVVLRILELRAEEKGT